jgi:hypothetical protein
MLSIIYSNLELTSIVRLARVVGSAFLISGMSKSEISEAGKLEI